jgi:hypothetical protein
MKHLRLLGIALLAIFALGAVVVATASATEPGLLYLEKEGKVRLNSALRAEQANLT